MIFDLDGTLVQTEKLKAISYAQAVTDLCSDEIPASEVLEAYKDVVGLPRSQVAQALVKRFNLAAAANASMDAFGVTTPWQAFIQLRLRHYHAMLSDPELIRANQWPHNLEVLHFANEAGCKTGLATMSRCPQANKVLSILGLVDAFDFVATRDDVENGKPDPEIYHLSAEVLAVEEQQCLVIEDSPSGVQAAIGAGMHCIAVTTPFTRQSIQRSDLLDPRWIVHKADRVMETVRIFLKEYNN